MVCSIRQSEARPKGTSFNRSQPLLLDLIREPIEDGCTFLFEPCSRSLMPLPGHEEFIACHRPYRAFHRLSSGGQADREALVELLRLHGFPSQASTVSLLSSRGCESALEAGPRLEPIQAIGFLAKSRRLGGSRSAPTGTPPRTKFTLANQRAKAGRRRDPYSGLIHTQLQQFGRKSAALSAS